MPKFLLLFLLILVFPLSSCGGGSGGSTGGSTGVTTPPAPSSTLSISASTVNISGTQWGALPSSVDITATISGNAVGLVAAIPPGANTADWLTIESMNGSQTNSFTLTFGASTTDLSPGSYTTVVRITSGNAAGAALDTRDVNVTFTLTDGVPIEATPASIEIGAVNSSSEPITRIISVSAEGNWSAIASDFRFVPSPSSGTGSQDVEITIRPNEVGQSNATISVSFIDDDASSNKADVEVIYTSVNPIAVTPQLNFEGIAGGEIQSEMLSILGAGNLDWSITANESWISFSTSSGVTDSDIEVFADPAGLAQGNYEATLIVTEPIANQVQEVAVTFEVAPKIILAEKKGLMFTSFPASANLTQSVLINDNATSGAEWTASADVPWLSVTPNGLTGGVVEITANPASLSNDSLSLATVTITSVDPAITENETIRVGLWKGATAPTNLIKEMPRFYSMAADPIRPYVYLSFNEDSLGVDTIQTVNVFTGDFVGSPIEPLITEPGNMSVSDDGAYLYLTDGAGGSDSTLIEKIDLESKASLAQWPLPAANSFEINKQNEIHFARFQGVPVIYSAVGAALHGETGELLGRYSGSGIFTASENGRTVCYDTTSVTPDSSDCISLAITGLGSDALEITVLKDINSRGTLDLDFGTDIDLSPDGETVFIADVGEIFKAGVDDLVRIPGGFNVDPVVRDIEVGPTGDVFVSYERAGPSGGAVIRRFDSNGVTLGTAFSQQSPLFEDTLVVLGDSSRTAITTFDSSNTVNNFWRLELITVP